MLINMGYSWHENGDIIKFIKWILLKYGVSTKREYLVLFKESLFQVPILICMLWLFTQKKHKNN